MHFLLFGFLLYFLPAIVAAARHTHNSAAIALLNVFLGWTLIGWFLALIMALASAPRYACYHNPYRGYYRGW
jgi:hypothetical protein